MHPLAFVYRPSPAYQSIQFWWGEGKLDFQGVWKNTKCILSWILGLPLFVSLGFLRICTFVSRVQCLKFVIKTFRLLSKIVTFKQKQLSKLASTLSQHTWSLVILYIQFYVDRVNSWLVIQNLSDACTVKLRHIAKHCFNCKCHNQRNT